MKLSFGIVITVKSDVDILKNFNSISMFKIYAFRASQGKGKTEF